MRSSLLSARSCLTLEQRNLAAIHVFKQVITSQFFLRANYVAFYLPIKSELNPLPLLEYALATKKKCYLPVLHPLKHNLLWFVPYHTQDQLQSNQFNIPEPMITGKKIIPAWALDLVFLPLVGFDEYCHRLGMGGGFYDRTFAFKNNAFIKKPTLIGLAYEIQKTKKLKVNSWDVSLDYVITEKQVYKS